MKKIKINESGFAVAEALIIVVVLILGVFVGFYVANHSKSTTSNKTSSSTQVSNKTKAQPSYFDFKELGIKFIPDKSLYGLSYKYTAPANGDNGGAYITDTAVTAAYNRCQADTAGPAPTDNTGESSSFAGITKLPGTYDPTADMGENQLVKQFNGFFITIGFPNGNTCASMVQSDMDSMTAAIHAAQQTFQKSLSSTITQD
jgi:hypothetical protein